MSYRICAKCVMDTNGDPDIRFDTNGVCNYCHTHQEMAKGLGTHKQLSTIVADIRKQGKRKRYDCLIGVSGGCDSTTVAYWVKKLRLRPFVVHLDNEYNTEVADENISRIEKYLGVPIHRYTVDWEEFQDLQRAYLEASVVDFEAISDHAITAIMYREAISHNIKYIIFGQNINTESIMPSSWSYRKDDANNIKNIHKKFGTVPLRTFPFFSAARKRWVMRRGKVKLLFLLNYIDYNRAEYVQLLNKEMGWEDYAFKHGESTITAFYQRHILPEKFGVDKRKAHFSSMINSGQMTRKKALAELEKPLYEPEHLEKEKTFVLEKLGFTGEKWERIMNRGRISHEFYGTDKWQYLIMRVLMSPHKVPIRVLQKARIFLRVRG